MRSFLGARRKVASLSLPVLLAVSGLFLPHPAESQYFGRNKVQYDNFETRILETPHFDIYFYPGMEEAIEDASRMAERWYERFARLFQHEFVERKPVVFYADHPDFQQTNTISGQPGEGTGGVTESLKNRVIMPLSGSYASTDHVLGHELVHAFQYDLAQSRRGGGMPGLSRLALWMIEGMAEYLSLGREDPLTAMWLRDALLRDDFPTLEQLSTESRFFPYRFGQAFWTYVGGTYGDEAVVSLFRTALRLGPEAAIEQVLGTSPDSLSVEWRTAVEERYRPLMEGRTPPREAGALLMAPSTGAGEQNVAPSISPDGRHLVVLSEKDLFSFNLYLADARTGEILRTLASAASDPHMDALRFIDSSGSWSPDGNTVAFVTFANGRNEIVLTGVNGAGVERRLRLPEEIGEITGPSFSPDGGSLVFSGQVGGLTDLYVVSLETDEVTRLTNDRNAQFQPTFSPDGQTIAFVTDMGPATDFDLLTYSEMQIGLYDLSDGSIAVLDLFGDVRHANPQYSPDGQSLYFLSDADGFNDIYRVNLATGDIARMTRLATAVTGITPMSPAISVARETGTVVFSVFEEFQFH
ncbi:MAG: peptidase S9, partial [Gemmatimonadota bacterium]